MGRVVDTGIAGGPLATWWGAEREEVAQRGRGLFRLGYRHCFTVDENLICTTKRDSW